MQERNIGKIEKLTEKLDLLNSWPIIWITFLGGFLFATLTSSILGVRYISEIFFNSSLCGFIAVFALALVILVLKNELKEEHKKWYRNANTEMDTMTNGADKGIIGDLKEEMQTFSHSLIKYLQTIESCELSAKELEEKFESILEKGEGHGKE